MTDQPASPFVKSPLNPVLTSGHETGLYTFREGVAVIVSLQGPEKNTIQYAPDGLNYKVIARVQIPPVAYEQLRSLYCLGSIILTKFLFRLYHIRNRESGVAACFGSHNGAKAPVKKKLASLRQFRC